MGAAPCGLSFGQDIINKYAGSREESSIMWWYAKTFHEGYDAFRPGSLVDVEATRGDQWTQQLFVAWAAGARGLPVPPRWVGAAPSRFGAS